MPLSSSSNETSTMTDEQLCKELAGFHKSLKEQHAQRRNGGRMANTAALSLNLTMFGVMAGTTIISAGLAAPVTAPVMAVSLSSSVIFAREVIRPELADKRLAYDSLLGELGIKHAKVLLKPIPFTEEAKNLKMMQTLVRIGSEKISDDEVAKALATIDPSFIQHCKNKVTEVLERGRERRENIDMARQDTRSIEKQSQQSQNNNETAVTQNPLQPNPTISSPEANRSVVEITRGVDNTRV